MGQPAPGQSANPSDSLRMMESILRSSGVALPPSMDYVFTLVRFAYPSGYAMDPSANPTLSVEQLNLASGLWSFSPSPQPSSTGLLKTGALQMDSMAGQPVENYGCLHSGKYVCRFADDMLPLRVYSSLPEKRGIVDQSMAVWNQASQKAFHRDLFRQVTEAAEGQVKIDWMGLRVPQGSLGVTPYRIYTNRVEIHELSMAYGPHLKDSDLVAGLSHELGHVLGLDHSDQPADLMYRAHTVNSSHGNALTQRDSWMLGWLYSRPEAIPIGFP